MYKRVFKVFLFLYFLSLDAFAQLQSPEQFLGYKVGERYTPHHRVVDYYRHVAAAVPGMVKLQTYGQTYEGRELVVAFVSAAQNITNLESIRTNNLRLAQLQNGSGTTANTPVLVWLSYNVHGNEASSSEASLLTLYELVNGANTQTKGWLQNTVVVMDPCLNPDGRDRYVNWFNSVSGKTPNPLLAAREHYEPWPGGRPNHYYFDLNRDWAWQTQKESQHRLALYNQWLPQIHVDFHEQGINAPYYFAPAAEPFHEVITPWQRSFQETIGRNHARYFDERGWLYFTKENFDLLYPAYGDTYPTYTGSIGMTYEQAGGGGGGRAGASVIIASGDTLTLYDRALHHHTTGLSTVEVASQNAAKLVTEFQQFYRGAVQNGVGTYNSYVIKYTPADEQRIQALLSLLQKNGITATRGRGNGRGYNYSTGREEAFTIGERDIVISTQQPKGVLANVLFEPQTKVVDSATYDITAWSLPYAYGLNAYATRQPVITGGEIATTSVNNPATDAYGYAIRWNGVPSVKLATTLAQKGIKLRFSETPFTAGGQQFDRGSVMILKTGNQYFAGLWDTVRQVANRSGVQLTPVTSGWVEQGYDFGSSRVRPLQQRKVALLVGEGISSVGSGEIWHFFDQQLDYPITLINVADMNRVDWRSFDVLIMPNGRYSFLTDKAATENFRNWISSGGNVVAMEGAVAALARLDWTIKSKKEDSNDTKDPYDALRRYENRERDYIRGTTPGSIFKVELDNSHPLAFGYPSYYYTLKQDDAIYEFIKEGGWNVGVLKKKAQVAGFVGSQLASRLQDGMLFGTQEIGGGTITYLTDNVLFRSFWEGGKLMFCNAVFMVGQ